MGVHFSIVEMDNMIWFIPLESVRVPVASVPNGPAGSAVSFNIGQDLKC